MHQIVLSPKPSIIGDALCRGNHSKGFTIPEILVAGSLFAFVVVAVTVSMRVSLDVEQGTDLRRQAAIKLQSKIDSLVDVTKCRYNPITPTAICNPVDWPANSANPIGRINDFLILGDTAKVPCYVEITYVTDGGFGGQPFATYPTPHIYRLKIIWGSDSLSHEIYYQKKP